MTTAATKTDYEFLDEMVQLIDGTHWTKSTLACPVFKVIKSSSRYGVNKLARDADGQPILEKVTYCIVGLVLKVADMEPLWSLRSPEFSREEMREVRNIAKAAGKFDEEALMRHPEFPTRTPPETAEQARRIVVKLQANIPHNPNNSYDVERYEASDDPTVAAGRLEGWNDHRTTDRAAVRALVVTTRDQEPHDG